MTSFFDTLRRRSDGPVLFHEHDASEITGLFQNVSIVDGAVRSLSASKLTTGTIQVGVDISSANYSAGVSGWQVDGDGNAEFNDVTVRGTIYAEAGELQDLDITGTLTMGTDGVLRTGTSGGRIELRNDLSDRIVFETGEAAQVAPGNIQAFSANSTNFRLEIRAPYYTDGDLYTQPQLRLFQNGTSTFADLDVNDYFEIAKTSEDGNHPQIWLPDKDESAPSYSWTSDPDTGMFRQATDSIGWAVGGSEAMRLDANRDLHIAGGAMFFDGIAGNDYLDYGAGILDIYISGSKTHALNSAGIGYPTNTGTGTKNQYSFSWSSPSMYARVDNTVEAVIGTVSDRRFKTNIAPLDGALDRVLALSPVEFDPLDLDGSPTADALRQTGLIADEVELVEPWLVAGEASEDSYQSVNYPVLTALLIGAVQELTGRVAELEAR